MGARAAAGLALLLALSAPLLQPGDASALRAQALAMGRGGRAEAADTWTHGSNALTDRVLYRLERVYQRSQDFENGEDVFHPSNFRVRGCWPVWTSAHTRFPANPRLGPPPKNCNNRRHGGDNTFNPRTTFRGGLA